MSGHPTAWNDILITFTEGALLFLAVAMFLVISIRFVARLTRRARALRPPLPQIGRDGACWSVPVRRKIDISGMLSPPGYRQTPRRCERFPHPELVAPLVHRRRSSRRLNDRLESYPLPRIVLPDWVSVPEKYSFPLAEATLRAWDPWSANRDAPAPGEDSSDQSPL